MNPASDASTGQKSRSSASYAVGLASATYLDIRGSEECYRARRYGRPLSLIVVTVSPSAEEALQKWMRSQVRASDIAAYLGNSTYALLLPEADARAVEGVEARLRTALSGLRVSSAAYPSDGTRWEDFLASVRRGITPSPGQAR